MGLAAPRLAEYIVSGPIFAFAGGFPGQGYRIAAGIGQEILQNRQRGAQKSRMDSGDHLL